MNAKQHFALAAHRAATAFNRSLDRAVEATVFWAFLVFAEAGRWWHYRRECAWCKRSIGGNPLARQTTSGICPRCLQRVELENDLRATDTTTRPDAPRTAGGEFKPTKPTSPVAPMVTPAGSTITVAR